MAVFELSGFSAVTPIGRGGFSEIYRARDDLTGRSVALKVIDASGLSATGRTAFRREAAALGSLSSHPHIVTLYQAIDLGDRFVLVLELCRESAHDMLARSGPVEPAAVISLGVKVASALATAHAHDMIHRDVKPQNVLITMYGEPALADFGIARLQASSRPTTATGMRAFTAVHAPPEVLQGGSVGPVADVYELGSTLYTLLAGRAPFAGAADEPLATTILRILREPVPPLESQDVPEKLQELLVRVMSKDPADRPAAAVDMAVELNDIERSLGLAVTAAAVWGRAETGAAMDDEPGGGLALSDGPGDGGGASEPRAATSLATRQPRPPASTDDRDEPVPVLPPGAAGTGSRHNLPGEASSFVGRVRELSEIRSLLQRARLVTLTGPGGSGKTRLALRLGAEASEDRRDGAFFVDLAALTPADSVSAAIADTVGVLPEPGRTPTESFAGRLFETDSLLIIDNCEHLVDQCARVVDALIRDCPRLLVIATSREPLGVDGEHLYRVPPLSLPLAAGAQSVDEQAVRASEAGALFVERAISQQPQFRLDDSNAPLVAQICRRLDGIPLALELAASRLRSLSLHDLDGRLDQMFRLLTGGSRAALPRHRTLLATIGWSYELLGDPERLLLDRLSVFADGFTLAAAEAVCGGQNGSVSEELDVVGALGSLVDKSLVQLESPGAAVRYRMLETIRAFASERLAERPGALDRMDGAHAAYFLDAAVQAVSHADGAEREARMDALRSDHENLHGALRYFFSSAAERIDDALRLCAALFPYWKRGGHYVEGAKLLERCLATDQARQDPALRAACLHASGSLLFDCGDAVTARRYLEEGAALAAASGDFRVLAGCRHELALALFRQGAYDEAAEFIEASVEIAAESGDEEFLARARCDRGHFTTDDPDRSRNDLEQALTYFRSTGNRRMAATALDGLAHIELDSGDVDAARAHFEEGLEHASSSHDEDQLQYWVVNLAFATLLTGDAAEALGLAGRGADLAERTGSIPFFPYVLLALALSLSATEDPQRAAQVHGAADALLLEAGETFEPFESALRDADQAGLRAVLGADAFDSAYDAGRPLGFRGALRLVGLTR